MLGSFKKFHFVGIGGAGMSAIAKILLEMGYVVSGSDIANSLTTQKLEQGGAKIYIGHAAENICGADAVVVSTAISQANPEIVAAREKKLTILHRSDMLAALMDERRGIAVAGAHGKTTTTSMIAVMLEHAGVDPAVIIGGEVEYLGGNAKWGRGQYLVAEADESDGSFVKLSPQVAVVTNIENDHLDFYKNVDNILHAFEKFLSKLPTDNGLAILCFDSAQVRNIAANLACPYISYGIEHDAEFMARNICMHGGLNTFEVHRNGEKLGTIVLNVPGRHNVANSLSAVILGLHVGLSFNQIAEALTFFHGAKRRFQTKGRVNGVWVVDDYAHHPTEIASTLRAAAELRPKRLICVFQPHRFTRTQFLHKEFGGCFTAADLLILTDIYAAGEQPIPGISGATLKEEVERQSGQKVTYIQERGNIARYLAEVVEPGDLVITMGAGNIYQSGEELVERLAQKH